MEDLLMAEFEQQHTNIRQIETLMFQKAQFFLSLEGLVVGGALAIAGSQGGLITALTVAGPLMMFMTAVGHYVLRSTVLSVAKMNELDFANRLVRLYFGRSGDRRYDAFMPSIAGMLARTGGSWRRQADQSLLLAEFTAYLNAGNAVIATTLIIMAVAVDARAEVGPLALLGILGGAFVIGALFAVYYRKRFVDRVLDSRELAAIAREREKLLELDLATGTAPEAVVT